MTTICTQCGAVLPARVSYCRFCDSSFSTELAPKTERTAAARAPSGNLPLDRPDDAVWRAELAHRLAAYRARRRRFAPNEAQTELPFDSAQPRRRPAAAVSVAEVPASPAVPEEEFAFTIAIGRQAKPARDPFEESRMEIDVSVPPDTESYEADAEADPPAQSSISPLFPVTSFAERRLAALIDFAFLLFAYGGFLTLFGSLGGQFTLSKLNAAVYAATLALFYFQYFALFTVFGGTTPGMMLRNLHLVRFTGEPPTPKQLLLRTLGYLLSAGSFFLGFAWAYWDEDQLTWHDRLSRTYLTSGGSLSHADTCGTMHRA